MLQPHFVPHLLDSRAPFDNTAPLLLQPSRSLQIISKSPVHHGQAQASRHVPRTSKQDERQAALKQVPRLSELILFHTQRPTYMKPKKASTTLKPKLASSAISSTPITVTTRNTRNKQTRNAYALPSRIASIPLLLKDLATRSSGMWMGEITSGQSALPSRKRRKPSTLKIGG